MFYFPLLRTKKGEINALATLSPGAREVVNPILQVPPPDMARDGSPTAPSSAFVNKMAENVQPVLAVGNSLPCFLDPSPAGLSPALLEELLIAIASYGGTPQPVFELAGSGDYARLYARIIGRPRTAIIRMGLNQMGASIAAQVSAALALYGLSADQTLLLLDMGDISTPGLPLNLYEAAFSGAISSVSSLGLGGIIVASCALPSSTPTLVNWRSTQFVRHELTVFRNIKSATGQPLHFGDYAVGNVITGPSPSRQGSPKVRYTGAAEYEVMKGQKTGIPPNTMSEQYNRLSLHLVGHHSYQGPAFSWGDDYIHKASQPGSSTTKRGNPAVRVSVHTSHHLELVASMLPSM